MIAMRELREEMTEIKLQVEMMKKPKTVEGNIMKRYNGA